MGEDAERSVVLLIDEMPLKRAFIKKFLEPWAEEIGLKIVSAGLNDLTNLQAEKSRLAILSLGAERLSEPHALAAYQMLVALDAERPIVVLGDRPDAENVEQAIRLRVAGYLPTSLPEEVAVAALNFVLAGGRYFPPDALPIGSERPQPEGNPPQEKRQLPLITVEGVEQRRPNPSEAQKNGGEDASSKLMCSIRVGEPPALRRPVGECAGAPIVFTPGSLTSRQKQVLACLRRAHTNKEIARELNMSEATVKVHVRQVMKKLGALNRTHAALLAASPSNVAEVAGSNIAPFLANKSLHQALRG